MYGQFSADTITRLVIQVRFYGSHTFPCRSLLSAIHDYYYNINYYLLQLYRLSVFLQRFPNHEVLTTTRKSRDLAHTNVRRHFKGIYLDHVILLSHHRRCVRRSIIYGVREKSSIHCRKTGTKSLNNKQKVSDKHIGLVGRKELKHR